jgi:hypothetical protein
MECRQQLLESRSMSLIMTETEVETVLRGTQAHFEVRRIWKGKTLQHYKVMQMTGTLTPKGNNQTDVAADLKICFMGYVYIAFAILILALGLFFILISSYGVMFLFLFLYLAGSLVYDRFILQKIINKLKSP